MPSDFLEKTLEDIIYESYKILGERGLSLPYRHIDRQFALPSGRKIDLVNWEVNQKESGNELSAMIIELKKDICMESSLWQLLGYVQEFTDHIVGRYTDINFTSVLIGDELSYNVSNALLLSSKYLTIYTYKYAYDGIRFKKWDETLDLSLELNKRGASPMYEQETVSKRLNFQETLRTNRNPNLSCQ